MRLISQIMPEKGRFLFFFSVLNYHLNVHGYFYISNRHYFDNKRTYLTNYFSQKTTHL